MKQGRKVSAIAVGLALSGLTSLSPAYAQQADEEQASSSAAELFNQQKITNILDGFLLYINGFWISTELGSKYLRKKSRLRISGRLTLAITSPRAPFSGAPSQKFVRP